MLQIPGDLVDAPVPPCDLEESDGTPVLDITHWNVTDGKDEQMKLLEDKGWTAETVAAFLLLRYQITGSTLTVQWIDGEAKKRAVETGKIKGKIEKDQDGNARAMFTDTTENLAKFVAEAGDDLFSKYVPP